MSRTASLKAVSVPLLLAFLALPMTALAQERPVPLTTGFALPFNFAPPGARATALGGTFIGLADDATAAAANPAGLTILVEPEVSAHLRFSSVDLERPGFFQDLQTSSESTTVPSFFSLVVPVRRAAFSVFYQQESNFKAGFVDPAEGRADLGPFDDPDVRRTFPGPITYKFSETDEVLLDQFGISAAVKVAPSVSIGGSVRFARADFSVGVVEDFDQEAVRRRFGNFYTQSVTLDDSDRDVTFNLGVLVKPSDRLSAGGVYRKGGEFSFEPVFSDTFLGDVETVNLPAVRFAVPDSYGVGFAVRPTERFTLALDVARIEYTDLDPDSAVLEDGTEVHAGAEYVFLVGASATPVSIRGGFFTDPDHDEFPELDSGQVHGTFGAGVVLASRFQIDWAVDIAGNLTETAVSLVLRF